MQSSKISRALIIAGLTITLASACSRPKKAEDTAPPPDASATAGAPETPVIRDQPMVTDPLGSDSGKIAGLTTVYFEYDQARLTQDARRKLAENANWIKNNPNFTIQIEGHTDSRGSVEYNLALGERRAKSVKSHLESLGVDSRRLTIISYGKEKPVASGDGEAVWSKNRRANFVPIQ